MTAENNGNVGFMKPNSSSNEDLSEYTDADESISAPTEFLAEFLSAVMLKDYATALKYCKLILQYEPNNGTAKEFYPLILEKLQQSNLSDEESSGDSDNEEGSTSSSSTSDSDSSTTSDSSDNQDEEEYENEKIPAKNGKNSKESSSEGEATTTGSYSSLEDDEPEPETDTDQLTALAAKYQHIDNADFGNGNKIYNDFSKGQLQLDNTLPRKSSVGISSDSESPTEPVTQQTVQLLRAKVMPK